MNNVVVFDLDGVITSEEAYWVTAGLVLHELLYSPRYWNINGSSVYQPPQTADECIRVGNEVLPESVMLSFKARSINSNWDTCYVAVCLCLLDLLSRISDAHALLPLKPWDPAWLANFRNALAQVPDKQNVLESAYKRLDAYEFQGKIGMDLIETFNVSASAVLGHPVENVFARYSKSWQLCHDLFQEWYLGDELFIRENGRTPTQDGKIGCIHQEEPLLPVEQLRTTLATLREQGYVLAVATGRPGAEAIVPLKNYGLYEYFDPARVVTHAEVALAEDELRAQGDTTSLVKPHPYCFAVAFDPQYRPHQPLPPRGSFVVVGDTTSDVLGGQAAGAVVIAVLTGARTTEARTLLEQSKPDFLVENVTKVPETLAQMDDLLTIQRLQFHERDKAEILLRRWFTRHMDLQVDSVKLTPKAVSLNSFNGIYHVNGEEYFFKTHVEEQGIVAEYYHAELLYKAGYNIVRPLRTIHQSGQQMVIYPVIQDPVMFDLMRAEETGKAAQATLEILVAAEKHECEQLLHIYKQTLTPRSAEEHAQAPIHQLFWHRITGGRLASFYEGKAFPLPGVEQSTSISFEDLLNSHWTINGESITGEHATLGQLLERAKSVLRPARALAGAIGHGDAHFGNVFLQDQQRYRYFDPAFAGSHSPLLDIVKPLFHNVYAMWMYFPEDIARDLEISVKIADAQITVEHNYQLTAVRQAMLETKINHMVRPLIAILREHNALPEDWQDILRLALMCCPLLTVNLLDVNKRPASICWLGLTQVMQMGNLSLLAD